MKEIIINCQYSSGGKSCANKTSSPTGLCYQHKRKVPLHDIHEGTGKKPLRTAIPRVGKVVTSNLTYTTDELHSNEEVVERMQAVEDAGRAGTLLGFLRNPFSRKEVPTIEREGAHKNFPSPVYRSSPSSGSGSSSSSSSDSFNYDATQAANAAVQSAVNIII